MLADAMKKQKQQTRRGMCIPRGVRMVRGAARRSREKGLEEEEER